MSIPKFLSSWSEQVFTLPPTELFSFIQQVLSPAYNIVARKDNFYLVLSPKENYTPLALAAHVDTVSAKYALFPYPADTETPCCLFSKGCNCLDDRLGVFHILQLALNNPRYPIVFLDQEENGCIGAIQLIKDFPHLNSLFPLGLNCFIEVDRHGTDEVVFYHQDNPAFEELFQEYIKNNRFAWTDICVLAPHYNRCGANVSAGYYNEHTQGEYMLLRDVSAVQDRLKSAVNCVENVLADDTAHAFDWSYIGDTDLYINLLNSSCISFSDNEILENIWFG